MKQGTINLNQRSELTELVTDKVTMKASIYKCKSKMVYPVLILFRFSADI